MWLKNALILSLEKTKQVLYLLCQKIPQTHDIPDLTDDLWMLSG